MPLTPIQWYFFSGMKNEVYLHMKRTTLIIGSILFLIFALFLIYFWREKGYEIVRPHMGNLTEAVYGLGKVKSQNRFEVILGVIKTVKHKFVNEGDLVKKGAQLIQFEDNVIIKSPIDGTVTLARLYPGETALPNTPILRVEDLTNKYIELSLEQQSILRVKPGQPAKITFETLRGQVLQGQVSSIFPRDEEFLVRINVANLDPNILPGMTADVSIEIGSIQNTILIPLNSVINGSVYIRKGHLWKKTKVEVDHVDGNWAEIKGGTLTVDDEIRVKAGP